MRASDLPRDDTDHGRLIFGFGQVGDGFVAALKSVGCRKLAVLRANSQ